MAIKYSIFYRIQNRGEFIDKFVLKKMNMYSEENKEYFKEKCEELMEIIVKYIIDENINDLIILLSKSNAIMAREFFKYLTTIKLDRRKYIKKEDINSIFVKDDFMIDFKKFLEEHVKSIDLTEDIKKIKLNEADDDPFGSDKSDKDPFGEEETNKDENDEEETKEAKKEDEETKNDDLEYNLDDYEDDPDFLEGVINDDDVTLKENPAGTCIYDVKGIMKSLEAIIQSSNENELEEIVGVKKAVELIFNGKKLKPEDVNFNNPQKAANLINKIGKNVDETTRNYLILKIKQPLIIQRDKQKMDIANIKSDINKTRDVINNIEK